MPRLRAGPGPAWSCRKYRSANGTLARRDRLRRPIGRSIVHDDDLELLGQDRLARERVEAREQLLLAVVRRHDHAHAQAEPVGRTFGRASRSARGLGRACASARSASKLVRDLDQPSRPPDPTKTGSTPRAPGRADRRPRRRRSLVHAPHLLARGCRRSDLGPERLVGDRQRTRVEAVAHRRPARSRPGSSCPACSRPSGLRTAA